MQDNDCSQAAVKPTRCPPRSIALFTSLCLSVSLPVLGMGLEIKAIAQVQADAMAPMVINGRLDSNSERTDNGRYYQVHPFEGSAGQNWIIELKSDQFDTYLILLAPDGEKIAENDNGEGTNARITVTLPTTGTYWLIAFSYAAEATGDYQLALRPASATEVENAQLLAEADRLNQQVMQLLQQGKFADAVPLAQQALQIREQLLGANHPDVALSLNNLAFLYDSQGRYGEAEPLFQRSLSIRETALGPDHPDVALSLNNLALLYLNQGRYGEAEPLLQRSLSIRETALGPDHPDVATSLNNLALLYLNQGRYGGAEPLYQRSLSIRETALGPDHPTVATSLNNLASLYRNQGRYGEAEPLYQRSLSIRETALGPDHPDVASSLNGLAGLYDNQGRYGEAEPLYQRSLSIRETALGPDHPTVATSLNNLASLYRNQGRYGEAEPLYQRSLSIRETALGPDHPDVASSLNGLAGLYDNQGRYGEAEPLLQRSRSILETALGPNHPDVASSLNGLAVLYDNQGRYGEAEPLYQRSRSILETALGPNHPDVALSLNNLASLYDSQGRYGEAEPLYQRSRSILETALGPDHPDVAQSLNGLAGLYDKQGRYGEAEPLLQRSRSILETALGPDHPTVATSLNNLALLYLNQGRYGEAEPLLQRSRSIRETALGPDHPTVATSLNNLALLYWAQAKPTLAVELLQKASAVEEFNLALNIEAGSEQRKQSYLATIRGSLDVSISFHLQHAAQTPAAANLALTTILQRKGRILEATSDNLRRLRQNLSPQDQPLLEQWQATLTQLSNLNFSDLGNQTPEQRTTQLAALEAQREALANQLAQRSTLFRQQQQPVSLEAVQTLIPADAALVELVRYQPFDPSATQSEQWGSPRYVAYVLQAQGNPKWVELGDAETIDPLVNQFQAALRTRGPAIKTIARELDAKLMQPIRALLGDRQQILLSPDSQLNLIPFAALVDQNNQYLVENYTITYLTSGRDLLRLQNDVPSRQPPVLLANPDYDNPGNPDSVQIATLPQANPVPTATTRSSTRSSSSPSSNPSSNQRSVDLTTLKFGPLPGTATEQQAIAPLLPDVTVLTQTQATENAIKQLQAPRILHIATHGFFLQDVECVPVTDSRGGDATVQVQLLDETCVPTRQNTENPLMRSGLALAGFNSRQSGGEDGVLTAAEVTGLNLDGTQLVVLSACETGLGNIANGEGVYGLRRSFVMAGAESQLISLWKVDDYATSELMSLYYQRLPQTIGRSEALRQVQLELLQAPAYAHPYYWAGFIFSGDWSPMTEM